MAPTVFGVRPVLRIASVSLVVGAAIFIGAKLAFPQLPMGLAWQVVLAIPIGIAVPGAPLGVHWLMPQLVRITDEYISEQTGQSFWRAKLAEIEGSSLIVFSDEHIQLSIRARGHVHRIGVSPKTDLHVLTSLLGSTVVHDKRREFAAARRLVEQIRASRDGSTTGQPMMPEKPI